MTDSGRARTRLDRDLRLEAIIEPHPDLGLVTMNGPNDPAPELTIVDGTVVGMDGKTAGEFDLIDQFVATHGIDLDVAVEAMALPDEEIALRMVDVSVSRDELVRLSRGLTPAKMARVAGCLDPVEMMFALKKLRARRRPANQAHVTNRKENPALLAADAAEAAARGFAEIETTVGVARYAPFNAIALLVGSQTGRPGVLTQCAVEEKRNLQLGMLGLTTYSETLSVYGTDAAMIDGDDTPWSKAFLASAYASRGIKVRFTSGSGSEALMGHAEGCSMLYLEARCLALIRAVGSQGVQNGGISTVALAMSLPGGSKAILAENLVAAWMGLEVASGNDAVASHSPIRRTAKLMGQFLPGTDFVTSGYSVVPRYDNMFGGGNYDADDLDEWTTIQRDWQVDAGIEPLDERDVLAVRERAATAVQAVFKHLGFPEITDDEVRSAVSCYDSNDMPDRDRARDVEAADLVFAEEITGVDVARALDQAGYGTVAEAVLGMQRLRVSGDYLQTSAIIGDDWQVESAVNDPNEYAGPGTGYRLEGERWERLQAFPYRLDFQGTEPDPNERAPQVTLIGDALPGTDPNEVVVGVGPAFLGTLRQTINGLSHEAVVAALADGLRSVGGEPRFVRVRHTSDLSFIAHEAATLSASRIGIGVQSKGTAVIHDRDMEPLDNLELFSMAPLLTLDSYRAIGRNAAAYALDHRTSPVPVELDNFARVKHIVQTTLLHATETAAIEVDAVPVEFTLR